MDISFMTCPNCKVELVIEQKVIDVNGLEGEAYDDAIEAIEEINSGVDKFLGEVPTVTSVISQQITC